jgi:DNA/RNA-binding domain of Phe-tRNA-synthetase-like protein
MLQVSEAWQAAHPDAWVGVLIMEGVSNRGQHESLERAKSALEEDLRGRFAGEDRDALKALPTIQAYTAYYKRFKKMYHVLLQLESVALKRKSLPRVAPLVEAMFMAEIKNQLLTAGHDLDAVVEPVTLNVAQGDEHYTRLNGQEQVLKAGDMYIGDAEGILSCIIYGPDRRTPINAGTQRVLFTTYAPPGIDDEMATEHLQDIEANVRLISPDATTSTLHLVGSRRKST